MSMTESGSKITKLTLYNKALNNPIHGKRWQKIIKDKLQNLKNDQTWKYNELPPG